MSKLTKTEHLLKEREFNFVRRSGKKVSTKNFILSWYGGEKRRLGIVVSGRIGKANIRNRIKRVIREHFRCNKDNFPIGDIVVIARLGAGNLENLAIRKELKIASKKVVNEKDSTIIN